MAVQESALRPEWHAHVEQSRLQCENLVNPRRTADPQQRPDQNYDVDAPGANDDGSGTVLSMELARVFAESGIEFDATLVFMTRRRRGAGPDRRRRARAESAATRRFRSRRCFNNDIVGNSHGGNGIVDGATFASTRKARKTRRRARWRSSPQRVAAALRAVAPRSADGAPRSLQPRRRPQRVQRRRVRRDRLPRGARELREAARRRRHHRRRGLSLPGAERARECRRDGDAGAGAAAAGRRRRERGTPTHRSPSVRLRRAPALGGVAGRRRLSDLLAQRLERPTGSTSSRVGNVTEFTLPKANIDDWVFGVAAVDAAGHESTVSVYVAAPSCMPRRVIAASARPRASRCVHDLAVASTAAGPQRGDEIADRGLHVFRRLDELHARSDRRPCRPPAARRPGCARSVP